MSVAKTPHEWSKDALFAKAQRYVEEMRSQDSTTWQFGFWSALSLELLIKAALADISPVLVADGKDWNNLLYATGTQPNRKGFNPRSADINNLLSGLESAFPEFTKEMLEFCVIHINRRNGELHSGSLPFDDLGTSAWLPLFYLVCEFLVNQMDETLESLFDVETAKEADEAIQAYKDDAAKAVKQSINAHTTIWHEISDAERTEREDQAKAAVTRYYGHRVACPACGCLALIHGSPAGTPIREIIEQEIIEKQRMRPASFECMACELKVSGYSKLLACGLGDEYTSESCSDPIEFFGIDIGELYRDMMGDDNNE